MSRVAPSSGTPSAGTGRDHAVGGAHAASGGRDVERHDAHGGDRDERPGKHVLIIDDSAVILDNARRVLEADGYRVTTTTRRSARRGTSWTATLR